MSIFYLQSFYSIMESIPSLESLIKKAKDNQYNFVALSDNENLYGMVEFLFLCRQYQIKPILGMKIFLNLKEIIGQNKDICLLIYAFNDSGINYLIQISNLIKAKQKKITLSVLKTFQKDLFFVLSNIDFLFANISDFLLIEKIFDQLKNNLNFVFFGLSLQSDFLEMFASNFLSLLSEKLKILVVPVHKTNYLENFQKESYKLLFKLNSCSKDFKMSFKFLNKQEIDNKYQPYYRDYKEFFVDFNTFLNKIQYNKHFPSDLGMPLFKQSSEESSFVYLEKIIVSNLKQKISVSSPLFSIYFNRLKKELKIIKQMGYEDYFLIVFDLVQYALKNEILVGPGRGSAPSSLVCFCLGITEVDPLFYNLMFERFLNSKRNKKPDIDLDFPNNKLNVILKYIYEKYGPEHTANIIIFKSLTTKSFIKNTNYIKYQKEFLGTQKLDQKQIKTLSQLEKIPQSIGTHPAGIIISNQNLFQYVPIQSNSNINSPFRYQTQLDANHLEKIGLIKIDLLSLKNLSLIENILAKINVNKKDKICWKNIPLDDHQTFQLLNKGDTKYIFQLESSMAQKILQKVKPQKFEDLMDILALNRPGKIYYVDDYCLNKQKQKNILTESESSVNNYIKHIIDKTYGIILYQEQIMEIAFSFAGYDLGEAEIFMKYILNKNNLETKENMIKKEFVQRSIQKGHSELLSCKIYDYILKFANYSFNKSHSVSYALISYRMAYLKTHYLIPYLTVILNDCQKIPSETEFLLKKIKNTNKIEIVPPNIFISNIEYKLLKDKLLLPLTLIRNITDEAVLFIINERNKKKFVDFYDFKNRCQKVLNNNLLRDLVLAGVFDNFGLNKNTLLKDSNLEDLEHEQYLLSFKKQILLDELPEDFLKKETYKIFHFDLKAIIS
ncbi:PHP domain-containing protein [Columbia Basin potato purple top phytoplasma]|uniref:DNA-directed DNA polymerase n=1 Tax=Columbia Basin potato purple top phytoplasma TaxID=307134 RepID=A0ABT5L9D4_9MOLU|nr:PHP domain-containing protein [Columbia Basin potato purple top phytoplasma]MDC9032205.1 PHP domain-containing protein [Columbia Basin potato purple top phytoplasma]